MAFTHHHITRKEFQEAKNDKEKKKELRWEAGRCICCKRNFKKYEKENN